MVLFVCHKCHVRDPALHRTFPRILPRGNDIDAVPSPLSFPLPTLHVPPLVLVLSHKCEKHDQDEPSSHGD